MESLRRNRASYTRTLAAICGRLDKQPDASICWTHPFAPIKCNSQFYVTSLWVVGSYARGALDCGDLDLVAEIVVVDGPPPPEYEVAKELYKFRKGVSLHIGIPHQNTSNTQFPEARLIWQGPGCDWQAAIDAITPDPSAGHYERPTDRIPFQPKQLRCAIEALDELLSLEEQNIIQWKFAPIDLGVNVEPLSQDEQELSQVVTSRCGRNTQQLLPHLIAYLRMAGGWKKPYLRTNFDRSMIGIAGCKVLVGHPAVLMPTEN